MPNVAVRYVLVRVQQSRGRLLAHGWVFPSTSKVFITLDAENRNQISTVVKLLGERQICIS